MIRLAGIGVVNEGHSHISINRELRARRVFDSSARRPARDLFLMSACFLIANDDGIYSPGLAFLARVAARFGDVRIVAPDVEQSSMGQAITASRPLRYRRTTIGDFEAYRVNGTPADCVALGAYHWKKVDAVLSGLNLGLNLGNSCWHSGTLAAAKQAALLGMRGIALSSPVAEDEPDFASLEPYLEKVLVLLLEQPHLTLVNVNFPCHPRGIRWTRQSVRTYDGDVVPGQDPMGRPLFWFTVKPLAEPEEGTDRWAIHHDYVSITPLRLDLTDEAELARAIQDAGKVHIPAEEVEPAKA
jgi:5'-nucleotidase